MKYSITTIQPIELP